MHGETHKVVTQKALSYLRSMELPVVLPRTFDRKLVRENVKLDEEAEYAEMRYFDFETGGTRVYRRRIAHHSDNIDATSQNLPSDVRLFFALYNKKRDILGRLDKVRREILRYRTVSEAGIAELGKVLHYVQDRCVPSPTYDKWLHDDIEKKARKYHELLDDPTIFDAKPIGRKELRKMLDRQPVARTPREAVIYAAKYTFAVLFAVLGNALEAPAGHLEKAVRLKGKFSGRVLQVYIGLALLALISFALVLYEVWKTNIYYLLIAALSAVSLKPALFAFKALSRNMQTFLNGLFEATDIMKTFSFLIPALSLSILMNPLPFLLFSLSATMLVVFPFLFKDFREIREDIPWFLWRTAYPSETKRVKVKIS